jgi:acetyl esterase
MHNINKETPPTIVFLGTNDGLIPVATVKNYQEQMKNAGVQCELLLNDGEKHGFSIKLNLARPD